ncbi:hypothetical protein FKW77_010139 [Venturia effusa]|uniref:F-box domain-containing protein n=1 Tax=Venturia effusa TaxID=50376 RepID=A0A517L8A8_9PEZI|nr:hypothetical protein FKW77_010139 [Venturia effusa]
MLPPSNTTLPRNEVSKARNGIAFSTELTVLPAILNLPRELRDKIYRSLLVYDAPLVETTGSDSPDIVDASILLVSRQISMEGQDILYRHNTFSVRISSTRRAPVLQYASNLRVSVSNVDIMNTSQHHLVDFLLSCKELHTLKLVFDINSSQHKLKSSLRSWEQTVELLADVKVKRKVDLTVKVALYVGSISGIWSVRNEYPKPPPRNPQKRLYLSLKALETAMLSGKD